MSVFYTSQVLNKIWLQKLTPIFTAKSEFEGKFIKISRGKARNFKNVFSKTYQCLSACFEQSILKTRFIVLILKYDVNMYKYMPTFKSYVKLGKPTLLFTWSGHLRNLYNKLYGPVRRYIYIHFVFIFYVALQPLWDLAAFQSPDLFAICRTSWTSDQLVTRPLPKHKTAQTQNKHIYNKYPCPEWDSKPRSQRPSERRQFTPQTARLLYM
jgi:hypothetical protein